MRCGAWVLWKMHGKKRPRKRASIIISMYNHYVYNFPLTDNPPKGVRSRYKEEDLEQCDGEVEVNVRIGIDGGCACCGSVDLCIEYKCKKCGNTHFEELPQDAESLSDFLSGFFVGMEEDHRFSWLMAEKARKEEQDAKMQKAMEEMKKRLEESKRKQAEKRKAKKKEKKSK